MNRKEIIALMESSKSEAEWNDNCNKVKATCGGYPDFWYLVIIQSGLADRVAESFGGSVGITMVSNHARPLSISGRPTSIPPLRGGEQVIGIYDQGLGKKQMVCWSLEDMRSLYDSYTRGMTLSLKWVAVSCKKTASPR